MFLLILFTSNCFWMLLIICNGVNMMSFPISPVHHKYCIIGAGPAGLQLGHLMQEAGRDYIIFEKGNQAGTFFKTYPRHGTLRSINKRFTGQTNTEFNMRHDWNSLLSNNKSLLMGTYTKEFFPHKDVLVQYLNDYQHYLNIKVQFDTEISNIYKINGTFTFNDQRGTVYTCHILTIATGLQKPIKPAFSGSELTIGYEEMELDPEFYNGKSVLILGRSNTGFEVATSIYGNTNFVHLSDYSHFRQSLSTQHVGDVRYGGITKLPINTKTKRYITA